MAGMSIIPQFSGIHSPAYRRVANSAIMPITKNEKIIRINLLGVILCSNDARSTTTERQHSTQATMHLHRHAV
jgi:glycerol kinase